MRRFVPTPPTMPMEIVTATSGALMHVALALDERPQLLGQDRAFLDVRLGEDEHEFLAAVAADQVRRAQVAGDRLGDPAQDDVAEAVPIGVVDRLEVVDVDEGDRQCSLVASGALDLGEEAREQRLAIGHAGQPVDRRPVVGLGHRAGDRVEGRREPALEAAAGGRHRGRVVARRQALRALDQVGHAEAEVPRHDEHGQGYPADRSHDRGHDGPRPLVDPRPEDRRLDEEKDPEGDRSRQRQDPEQAHHARTVRAVTRLTDPPVVPRVSVPEVPAASRHRRVGRLVYSARPSRPAGNAREPGGQRSRVKGASAVP